MSKFVPLDPHVQPAAQHISNPPLVTEYCIYRKLPSLNPTKASRPDNPPAWLLKENANLLAPVVTDILNCSFKEAQLLQSWKHADITPIPKQTPVRDVNKHLRPISLTPIVSIVSKLAEEIIVDRFVKPAVLKLSKSTRGSSAPSLAQVLSKLSSVWLTHGLNPLTETGPLSELFFLFQEGLLLISNLRETEYDIPGWFCHGSLTFTPIESREWSSAQIVSPSGARFQQVPPPPSPLGLNSGLGYLSQWSTTLTSPDQICGSMSMILLFSETVSKGQDQESNIQNAVDTFSTRASVDKYELNEPKYKELRISFNTKSASFDPIVINGKDIKAVPKAKV